MAGISVCIVCRNEADRLGPCLESVTWADEVLLMDLQSTDDSAAVGRAHGATVVSRAPHPVVEPLRNEIASRARNAWVLALDPDERVTPGLAAALQAAAHREELDAVVTPRTNIDLGYPPTAPSQRYEPQIRMYRRDRIMWPERPNTLPVIAEERLLRLPEDDAGVLLHDRNRTIPEALERAMRYAPEEAKAMAAAGELFSARRMLAAILREIDRKFVRTRAWEDGVPGVLRATILVNYKVAVWSCLWQQTARGRQADDELFVRRVGAVVGGLWAAARDAGRLGARATRAVRGRLA